MPSLVKLYEEFKKDGFVVVAINIRESRGTAKKFVEKNKITFPVLLDRDGKVASRYGVRGHPAHFLINGKGELIGQTIGGRDWATDGIRGFIGGIVKGNKLQRDGSGIS